jgi:glycerate-2-kinase
MKSKVELIYHAALDSVRPEKIISNSISVQNNILKTKNLEYPLSKGSIWVVGAGKATAFMALEIEKLLDKSIAGGCIAVKYGHSCPLSRIKVIESAHPIPDEKGIEAAKQIAAIVKNAGENDLLICLWSGGGSALLADVVPAVSLEDIITLNNLLLRCGANIYEINAVRKHLSTLKGGKLAQLAAPATILNLMISDVIGDATDVIASGPATADTTTFENALWVIEKYQLKNEIPSSVLKYLQEGKKNKQTETPKIDDLTFKNTHSQIIANNKIALNAAVDKAEELGYEAIIVNDGMNEDAADTAEFIIETALQIQKERTENKPVCLIWGGETTLEVQGNGKGGRCQHIALFAAMMLKNTKGITVLSAGTDGTDGPTDAAGAIVNGETLNNALAQNLDPISSFRNFDSYNFLKQTNNLLFTGPTQTNVMDLVIVLID